MPKKKKIVKYYGLPEHGKTLLWGAAAFSALIHLFSFIQLGSRSHSDRHNAHKASTNKVKVRLVSKSPDKAKEPNKKIVETPMEPTKAPEKARYHGAQDHIAKKETKLSEAKRSDKKGLDPGLGGTSSKQIETSTAAEVSKSNAMPKAQSDALVPPRTTILDSRVAVPSPRKPRNAYEALIPSKSELNHQVLAGYQDHIRDDVAEGEKVDLNTSDYRYIGYFTSIRKAFELVWAYPSDAARRGLQGNVTVEFTIAQNGKVDKIKILESSGHRILDNAVVSALNLSSPYAPLPDGLNKERLTVVGSFRYVLSGFAGAH